MVKKIDDQALNCNPFYIYFWDKCQALDFKSLSTSVEQAPSIGRIPKTTFNLFKLICTHCCLSNLMKMSAFKRRRGCNLVITSELGVFTQNLFTWDRRIWVLIERLTRWHLLLAHPLINCGTDVAHFVSRCCFCSRVNDFIQQLISQFPTCWKNDQIQKTRKPRLWTKRNEKKSVTL